MKSVLKFHYFVDDKAVIQPGTKCSPRSHSSLRKRGLTPKSWFLNFASFYANVSLPVTPFNPCAWICWAWLYFWLIFMEQSLKLKISLLLYQNGSFWQLSAHAPTPGRLCLNVLQTITEERLGPWCISSLSYNEESYLHKGISSRARWKLVFAK